MIEENVMKTPILKAAAALVLAAGLAMPGIVFAQAATGVPASAMKPAAPMHHHGKIDCGQVMSELNGGKKAKEVATDMKISTSSVYRCKKKEVAEASKKPETAPAATPAVKK
jgi:hypothetical protein